MLLKMRMVKDIVLLLSGFWMVYLMIRFVVCVMFGLAVVVIVDLWRYVLMSEKERFYRKQTKNYEGLNVGFVELKGYEK